MLLEDACYAAECRLKHTSDNRYIGLRIVISTGRICAIPWSVYHDAALADSDGRAPRLMAQQLFGSRCAQVKGLVGHLVRILDFAICSQLDLQCCLYMQLSELRSAGFATTALHRLVWHIHTRVPFLRLPTSLRDADMVFSSMRLFRHAKLQSLRLQLGCSPGALLCLSSCARSPIIIFTLNHLCSCETFSVFMGFLFNSRGCSCSPSWRTMAAHPRVTFGQLAQAFAQGPAAPRQTVTAGEHLVCVFSTVTQDACSRGDAVMP